MDNIYKRHTCIICKRKRYELYMQKVLFNSWACKDGNHFKNCCDSKDIKIAEKIRFELDKLVHLNIKHIVGK